MASLHKNSLMLERNTFLPSAVLENGVNPDPLSCISHLSLDLFTTSPKYLAHKVCQHIYELEGKQFNDVNYCL